jgi:hypothetical protein
MYAFLYFVHPIIPQDSALEVEGRGFLFSVGGAVMMSVN